MYRKNGKLIEEKAGGRFKDNMSPAKASQLRTLKITGKLEANKERRQRINDRVTMDYLFKVFRKHKTPQVSP